MSDAETPRLYKKGDKITLVVEVLTDQKAHSLGEEFIHVKTGGGHSEYIAPRLLRQSTLEPAPEPPYVPKVGERFKFADASGAAWSVPLKLVWMDEKSIVYDTERHQRTHVNRLSSNLYNHFVKVD